MLIGSVLSPNANNSPLCVLIVLRAFLVGHGTMIFGAFYCWWHPGFDPDDELGPYILKFCKTCRCVRRVIAADNPVWLVKYGLYEHSFQHSRNLMAVMDNLFLPSDQRDKRFLDAYAKYEAEFENLPSSHAIGSGRVRDPFLLSPNDESSCGSVYGNSNAFAYGDGVDFDVDETDSCAFGY